MRKSILLSLLLIPFFLQAELAGEWKIDASRSSVKFVISNFGVDVDGSLAPPAGKVIFHPNSPGEAKFSVSVDPASIETGIKKRDKHLKNKDFFYVEEYPKIKFESTSVSGSGEEFTMKGKLTIKDVTKEVVMPFTFRQSGKQGLFESEFVLNRKDYDLGGMMPTGSDVTVKLFVVVSH